MGERQFNHRQALSRAYAALYVLRQEGNPKPALTEISKRSGIQRSTIHTSHPDWKRFREVVRLGLSLKDITQAGVELEEKAGWVRRVEAVEGRLARAEANLQGYKLLVDTAFTKLAAQLHKYVMLSKETPSQVSMRAALLKENVELKQEVQRLRSENRELILQTARPADLRPLSKKEVLIIYDNPPADKHVDLEDPVIEVTNKLDDYFAASHEAQIPKAVYIMCGNFASGKSRWIKEHSPLMPGVNLYIDGVNQTARMRKLLLKRIRKLSPDCTIACVRVRAALDDCLNRNENPARMRLKKSVPRELIMRVSSEFEEVSLAEGFDQILVTDRK
jgi:cell division protein FtsB